MNLSLKTNRRGNVLLAVLCTVVIVGGALAVYMSLVSGEHQLTMRSLAWNNSFMIAEAGIEEALTHGYYNYPTNLAINGWTAETDHYVKQKNLGEGYYKVQITKQKPMEIICEGFYPMLHNSAYLSRTIKVRTKNKGVFAGAVITKDWIQMNGNNVYTDSFASCDPAKSTAGHYDPLKKQDKGDVLCTGGLLNSLSIGNANLWGHIYTSPTASVYVGPGGAIGDASWQTTSTGIQGDAWHHDYNVQLPDVRKPFVSGDPTTSGVGPDGLSYNMIMGDGNYEASTMNGKVLVTGNAVLYVTSGIKFDKGDTLNIMPGATLKLYVAGPSAIFSVIANGNSDPKSFQYFGLPANQTIDIKDNAVFTGTIYAPQADFSLTGNAQVFGSVVTRTAFLNGNAAIHYDECLDDEYPFFGFVLVSWQEL